MLFKSSDLKDWHYDLHCDKSFDFNSVQEKCIRSLVGNCLYDTIRANVIAYNVVDTAPQIIKDLVDGSNYTITNQNVCGCTCECQCDKRAWVGLRELVKMCIKLTYLNTKRAEILRIQNKTDGSVKLLQKSLQCDKMDLHNMLAYYNNIGDCNCVSLFTFVDDHEEITDFCGMTMSLISII